MFLTCCGRAEDTAGQCCLLHSLILTLVMITTVVVAESGCSIHSVDAGFPDSRIAACQGKWHGHVNNASSLCATGWQVCNWNTDAGMLNKISWTVALSIDGCYGYNAAQDGGRCRECRSDLQQDDLAGLGRGCPYQNKGQTSCINGGRIDASCCVDSHISLNKACQQQPWINGVMCCKQSAKKPHIVVPPPATVEVNVGQIFMLSCQATGNPPTRVQWYKNGAKVPSRDTRMSVLLSGDLLVTLAKKSDSGQYSCEVINDEGIDMAHTQVLVQEHYSGCEDGTTEGLSMFEHIHACAGRWKGHIKQGSMLCSPGWRVCNSHDQQHLKDISWMDIFDIKNGCFAYNVANNKNGKCRQCHSGKGSLAGIGRDCGRVQYDKPSCLSQGRIDVFKSKNRVSKQSSCSYMEGITTGVLCCKKTTQKDGKQYDISIKEKPHCSFGCENGGQCIGYNVCICPVGYKGAMCQNAVCPHGCGSRARCVSPGKCECIHPYMGTNCSEKTNKDQAKCKLACLNGGRCWKGKCKCPPNYHGSSCQTSSKHIQLQYLNETER